ncbi:MAG: hypothetical protein AAF432_11660 [Planctomycetota bacterium]
MHHAASKMIAIVLAFGVIGLALLHVRQQRVNLTNEIKVLHEEYRHHEQTLWQLQTEIAVRVRPDQIRATVDQESVDWQPIPMRPLAMPAADTQTIIEGSEPIPYVD